MARVWRALAGAAQTTKPTPTLLIMPLTATHLWEPLSLTSSVAKFPLIIESIIIVVIIVLFCQFPVMLVPCLLIICTRLKSHSFSKYFIRMVIALKNENGLRVPSSEMAQATISPNNSKPAVAVTLTWVRFILVFCLHGSLLPSPLCQRDSFVICLRPQALIVNNDHSPCPRLQRRRQGQYNNIFLILCQYLSIYVQNSQRPTVQHPDPGIQSREQSSDRDIPFTLNG